MACLCCINMIAQDAPLVGTWEGTYKTYWEEEGDVTVKMVTRINRYGEKYRIRIKEFPTKRPSDVNYWEDCSIMYHNDESISFIRERKREPETEDGKIVGSYEAIDYYHVTLSEGCLHFSYDKYIVKNFDRNGNYINKEEFPGFRKVILYKDDSDW